MDALPIKWYFYPTWEESVCKEAIIYLTEKLRKEIIGTDIHKRSEFKRSTRLFSETCRRSALMQGGQMVMALNDTTSDKIVQNFMRHLQPPKKTTTQSSSLKLSRSHSLPCWGVSVLVRLLEWKWNILRTYLDCTSGTRATLLQLEHEGLIPGCPPCCVFSTSSLRFPPPHCPQHANWLDILYCLHTVSQQG